MLPIHAQSAGCDIDQRIRARFALSAVTQRARIDKPDPIDRDIAKHMGMPMKYCLAALLKRQRCQCLCAARQHIRKMIANEELPAVKVGREWRIPMESIRMFLEENL